MIGYKMFPRILEKIWAGIDAGASKMDIWESLSAQERHEVNKLTEGDKGEQEKAETWERVVRMYRRSLVGYPYVKRGYISIDTCPSCGYDNEDVTIFLMMPYALDHVEELAKLDLQFNLMIRPYYFDVEYIDYPTELDMSDCQLFYRYSKRRAEISDTLDEAGNLIYEGKTIAEVGEALGVTKQSVSDWMDKDWLSFSKDEYIRFREEITIKENNQRIKEANEMFAKGYSKNQVCRALKVSYDIMNSWIHIGSVEVPPFRKQLESKIVEMAMQGKRQIDIAEHFEMGQTTISEILRKNDEYIRWREEQLEGKINLAIQLSENGISSQAIGESIGRSKSTINRWLKQRGVR